MHALTFEPMTVNCAECRRLLRETPRVRTLAELEARYPPEDES